MKARMMWAVVLAAAVLALIAGVAGALSEPLAPDADVAEKINYQGQLTDSGGTPLDGTYTMRFEVWSAETGGTEWWDSGPLSVQVDNGLFDVDLAIYQPIFDGRELWLRIQVDGEWLSPRQEFVAVPYAMGLRPGARIQSNSAQGYGLDVNWTNSAATGGAIKGQSATSIAVFGYSPGGYGLYGYSQNNYAVYGYDGGWTSGLGYGGYFDSANGTGVYGHSSASTVANGNVYFAGVYGRSDHGVGVLAVSEGSSPGVLAFGDGTGYGVHARSENSAAIYAESHSSGTQYGLFTPDIVHAGGWEVTGAVMRVAQNGGDQALELGDVVEFSGLSAPLKEGDSPVIQVSKAASANSTAVAGVVYGRFDASELADEPQPDGQPSIEAAADGPVAPGEYLLVVVEGPAQVKAGALGGDIQAGDLLSTSAEAGHATHATEVEIQGVPLVAPGTVLGKALEPLAAGQELIYVYVTLQ